MQTRQPEREDVSEPISPDAVRIATPADVRPAAQALNALVQTMFACRAAIAHDIGSKQMMRDAEGRVLATDVFGWTDSEGDRWWRTPHLALNSPLPTACRYEAEPFWVNAEGFHPMRPNHWLDEISLHDFEARCLATAVIVVPVHLPFGHIGAASYGPIDRTKTDLATEFAAFADSLGLYTRAFIASYHRVMVAPERLPARNLLSKREVECLRWAAIGKTDDEIGLIISRSRATVRFHVQNAASKLDSVNRSQTIFKAAQLGYLTLNA